MQVFYGVLYEASKGRCFMGCCMTYQSAGVYGVLYDASKGRCFMPHESASVLAALDNRLLVLRLSAGVLCRTEVQVAFAALMCRCLMPY